MTKRSDLGLVAGLLLALVLPACGGSDHVVPTPPPVTTPPCSQTNLFQNGGPVPSKYVVVESVTTSTTARLDLTLDWTFPSSVVGLYLVPAGSCNLDGFNKRTCSFLVRSESGPKPRKVSAANVAPGGYDVLMANFASQDESMVLQVVLSSSGCPAFSSAQAASSAGEGQVSALRKGLR
jgi:hypothetical protein